MQLLRRKNSNPPKPLHHSGIPIVIQKGLFVEDLGSMLPGAAADGYRMTHANNLHYDPKSEEHVGSSRVHTGAVAE